MISTTLTRTLAVLLISVSIVTILAVAVIMTALSIVAAPFVGAWVILSSAVRRAK